MNGLAAGAAFARLVDAEVAEPRTAVEVPRGRFRRPWRMQLRLTPWWPGARSRTLVELVPCGKVVPTARYFDAGHRLLDEVADGLRAGSRGGAARERAAPQQPGASQCLCPAPPAAMDITSNVS